jgi:hypothetical protein
MTAAVEGQVDPPNGELRGHDSAWPQLLDQHVHLTRKPAGRFGVQSYESVDVLPRAMEARPYGWREVRF